MLSADRPRIVCAWCGSEIRPGIEPASHGICATCAIREMDAMPAAIRHQRVDGRRRDWTDGVACGFLIGAPVGALIALVILTIGGVLQWPT